jgi:GNAT superfamily N-acetyltransferase
MITTRLATSDDAEKISALLTSNSADRGGMLLGDWSVGEIKARLRDHQPIIVAISETALLGALLAEEKTHASAPPVMAMLAVWPGRPDAYVYGPVCVAADARGKGVLEALYAGLVAQFPGREAVLFIRADNPRSRQAHVRLGMREVAHFTYQNEPFVVLSNLRWER